MAGCRANEESKEYSGGPIVHGALTYFLVQEIKRAGTGSRVTHRDVFEPAAVLVSGRFPAQHPQMEGPDRDLFGIKDYRPMRSIPVLGHKDALVTLGAGAALGMTRGSRWAVLPKGSRSEDPADAIAEVEVKSPGSVTAEARVVKSADAAKVVAGARAVEVAHGYGEMLLGVYVQAAGAAGPAGKLKALIEKSKLLKLTTPAKADLKVVAKQSTWEVIGRNGLVLMQLALDQNRGPVHQPGEGVPLPARPRPAGRGLPRLPSRASSR